MEDVLIRRGQNIAIRPELLNCDYYRYLESDPEAISKYSGEYMTGYDFAEETRELLRRKHDSNS